MEDMFTYPTKVQTVHLLSTGKTVVENAFLCPVLGIFYDDAITMELYISREYNVNLDTSEYVAGRFVFAEIEQQPGKFVLNFLAEETATVIEDSRDKMRDLYKKSRDGAKIGTVLFSPIDESFRYVRECQFMLTAETAQDDPLCRLDRIERSQVCSSVLSSSYFAEKILYVPDKRQELACKVKTIPEEETNMMIKEWMLSCPAISMTDDNIRVMYYVGHGDTDENVFLYADDSSNRYINFVNISTKVRNVRGGRGNLSKVGQYFSDDASSSSATVQDEST